MPATLRFRRAHPPTDINSLLWMNERGHDTEYPRLGDRRRRSSSQWQSDAVAVDLLERIVTDPAVAFGRPTIRGHRIWVSLILGHLAEGWTVAAVVAEYPQLEVDDVRACLAFGAQLANVRFAELDTAG